MALKRIINVAMQLAKHYSAEKQVEEAFEYSYKRMVAEGLVDWMQSDPSSNFGFPTPLLFAQIRGTPDKAVC